MSLFTLQNERLKLLVSGQGGAIEGLWWQNEGQLIPLLRPGKQSGIAVESSCFPLVPFGNRVSGNAFTFAGKDYRLQPNVAWDSHYLHGDGWLTLWQPLEEEPGWLVLEYQHLEGPYRYAVQQTFHLSGDSLTVSLTVVNNGKEPLPFGLGWHPYFPLTAQTSIQARATGYWLEREQWLAGEFQPQLPKSLDFNQPNELPRRWVNNAFSGWDGQAKIAYPQEGVALSMETDPPAPCYFIFVSDPQFDEGYDFDFFCLEPMSHAPDDHHRPGGGLLTTLKQGETLGQNMRISVSTL
ncbi:Aldose 1-epimerase [Cedecea lapagei]|uniref:Aldose 1-epimerase n=1 Tax=Cedecea lapagei TaxID=158823 RepID=A0A447UYR3_9ENTR|nr:aldose 1-epimerase [Cedecea lapagei]VEB95826.1 Aldose 1-epimerase [Cedecea lapagei]